MRECVCICRCKLSRAQHLRQACNVLPVESSTRDSINWASEGDIAVQKMARERLSLRSVGEMIFGFLRLPEAVWSRLLVLFVALAGVKLALVARLGKELFEAHWRLGGHERVWGDYVLFGFFVLVGYVSLLRLQRHCALAGIRAIRAANA